jgi:hypothetical protein
VISTAGNKSNPPPRFVRYIIALREAGAVLSRGLDALDCCGLSCCHAGAIVSGDLCHTPNSCASGPDYNLPRLSVPMDYSACDADELIGARLGDTKYLGSIANRRWPAGRRRLDFEVPWEVPTPRNLGERC